MADLSNLSPAARAAYDRLMQGYGRPLTVTSGYRDPSHNAKVGGAKGSQHMHGNALDISAAGMSQEERLALAEAARNAGFQGFGFYDNSLHFDVGPPRAWGADYTRNSLPDWAAAWMAGAPAVAPSGAPASMGQPEVVNALAMAPQQPELRLRDMRQDPAAFMSQNRLARVPLTYTRRS